MIKVLRCMKLMTIGLFVSLLVVQSAPVGAQSGRVQLHIGKVGFVVGVSGGNGTLFHNEQAYPLTIGGVRVGLTIGASSADLVGNVYNLTQPSDIEGTYTAGEGSAAFGAGAESWVLTNEKGVRLEMHGNQVGFEASLDLGGMTVRLK